MAKSNSIARGRGQSCPMDATLPQTKRAQKLKPYEGELPSYIQAMDEYASRAGLTIRHLRGDDDYIVLVYSGTREQIGRFGLSKGGEESIHWPGGTRVPSGLLLYKLAPTNWRRSIGRIFKINEQRYAMQIKERLPQAISKVGDGIEYFDFNDCGDIYVAYVGEKEKLISEGVAAADMFPDDPTEDGKYKTAPNATGYQLVIEETIRLHGGDWAYLKYPQNFQKAEEAKRKLFDYKTPEEYRQHLLKVLKLASTFVELAPVETKARQIYTIDAESKELIEEAWVDLYWTIHDATIKSRTVQPKLTEEEKAEKRNQYADAQNDAAFRSFVQGLVRSEDALH
jgi:hypothetical protein